MSKILISLLFCFSIAPAFSQITGFQGKRSLIEAYTQLNYQGLRKNSPLSPLTFRLHGEYVVGRKNSFALNYERLSFTMPTEVFHVVGDVFDEKVETSKYNYKVATQLIGAEMRFYRRLGWSLAPLGKYTAVGLHYAMAKGTAEKTDEINTVVTRKQNGLLLTVGFGNRMIFWNRITMDMGVQLGVHANFRFERTEAPEDPLSNMERYTQIYFKENSANYLTKAYLFRANLGIGLLLF
ncbi:MAG: hypothetical protein ACKVTZ_07830 [Bacteroidia bacterium]